MAAVLSEHERTLLEATLSVDDVLKKKVKKRPRLDVNTCMQEVDKMKLPLIVLSYEIPFYLTPKEALYLSLTCVELKSIGKKYPREKLVKTMHRFARITYSSHVGLIALDYAYHKICGLCSHPFSGGFSKKMKGVYAHEPCVIAHLIDVPEIRKDYQLDEPHFDKDVPVITIPAQSRLPFPHIVSNPYNYPRRGIWRSLNEMVPLKWTFNWLVLHDKNISKHVYCNSLEKSRMYLMSMLPEFRQVLNIRGRMYASHLEFALELAQGTALFKDYFNDSEDAGCLEQATVVLVRVVVERGMKLLKEVARMKKSFLPIFRKQKVELRCELADLRDRLPEELTLYFSRSEYTADIEQDLKKTIQAWKNCLWHQIRISRLKRLREDEKLHWISELCFKELSGDYLSAWNPRVSLEEIKKRVFALEMSPEFKKSGEKLPTKLAIERALPRTHVNKYYSETAKAKLINFENRDKMKPSEKAIELCRRVRLACQRSSLGGEYIVKQPFH